MIYAENCGKDGIVGERRITGKKTENQEKQQIIMGCRSIMAKKRETNNCWRVGGIVGSAQNCGEDRRIVKETGALWERKESCERCKKLWEGQGIMGDTEKCEKEESQRERRIVGKIRELWETKRQ